MSQENSLHVFLSNSPKFANMVLDIVKLLQFCVVVSFAKESLSFKEDFDIDLNEVLNVNYMPSALFLHQDDPDLQILDANFSFTEVQGQGDFGKAYELMGYHRKMMNEYQCNDFIAKQIISEISPNLNETFSRRSGSAIENENTTYSNMTGSRKPKMIQNPALLYDTGSAGYKKWLAKTTTLEDITRQLSANTPTTPATPSTTSKTKNRYNNFNSTRRSTYRMDENPADDYMDDEFTGYAIPAQYPPEVKDYGPTFLPTNHIITGVGLPAPYPTAGNKNGYYPSAHEGGYEENYAVHNYGKNEGGGPLKDLGLKDVMEIAMTTLAFLSFGMFLLQVLMCITMDKSNNMMMMPMEAPGDGEVEEIRRKKRSIEVNFAEQLNELARRTAMSMDAVVYVEQDDGECLYRALCENNKYARQQSDGRKIWIPVWGLGLSWLSSRMARPDAPGFKIRLGSLKASVYGLGGADCTRVYSACDMAKWNAHKLKEQEEYIKKAEEENYVFQWRDDADDDMCPN